MEDLESPLDPNSGPITAGGVAFEELQTAITKLIAAELKYRKYRKYSTDTSISFNRTQANYKSRLNKALFNAKRLYKVANTDIDKETAQESIAKINTKLDELQKLDDSQSGGSRRRRIKSARKKSKRHKKTHRRK
jgi:hypothetical protein